jgi:hypothetical protein
MIDQRQSKTRVLLQWLNKEVTVEGNQKPKGLAFDENQAFAGEKLDFIPRYLPWKAVASPAVQFDRCTVVAKSETQSVSGAKAAIRAALCSPPQDTGADTCAGAFPLVCLERVPPYFQSRPASCG